MGTPEFWQSLKNSFGFAITAQIITLVLANILAVILSSDFRGKWFALVLIMLPWSTPIALGAVGWLWLLDSKFSPIDWVLRYVGLLGDPNSLLGAPKNLYYLGKAQLAQASIIMVYVWRMLPLSAVILLAGLTSIPQDLLDQAEVDGSSFWRTLFQIKLPLILPIMIIALLFSFIYTVGDMAVVYVLTRGGPGYSSDLPATFMYAFAFNRGRLGFGASSAMMMFFAVMAIIVPYLYSELRKTRYA
jgi:multiple sugar transport system permease protein